MMIQLSSDSRTVSSRIKHRASLWNLSLTWLHTPVQVTRAMRFSSFPSAAAYSAFSARLPAISAHGSAQRTRSRFGVVVATCLLCCTLLFSLSALPDKPCFSCRITLPCFDYLYPTSGRDLQQPSGGVSSLKLLSSPAFLLL